MSETKTVGSTCVTLQGYRTIYLNRENIHKNAKSGSWGVAFLIKDSIYTDYRVTREDYGVEGLLAINLHHLRTATNIMIIGSYIPPDSSVHATDNDMYFQQLVSLIYDNANKDFILMGGDYNARLGNKLDYIPSVDDLPTRIVVDTISNDQGVSLANFCIQTNTCVVNGRVCPLQDGFTSVSHRGKAVVDYFVTRHDDLKFVDDFKVLSLGDIIDEHNLVGIGDNNGSDHNILMCRVNVNSIDEDICLSSEHADTVETSQTINHASQQSSTPPPTRYKKGNFPDTFMNTEKTIQECGQLIDDMLYRCSTQEELDQIYDNYVNLYHAEMSTFLKKVDKTPKAKKILRHTPKPYWSEDLTLEWKICHEAERAYHMANRGDPGYIALKGRSDFLHRKLRKNIKKAKRKHERTKVYQLEQANTENPTEFWRMIQRLGPKKSAKIPWEVEAEDGSISTDSNTVLSRWRNDFEGLFKPPGTLTEEQTQFMEDIKKSNSEREQSFEAHDDQGLNTDFTFEEVAKIVKKSKLGKAPGIDGLVNECMKTTLSTEMLTVLFNRCLSSSMLPTLWSCGIINPIPKSPTNNPRIPLNYRGISLLSIVSKLYTAALAYRITTYLETNNKLCNEQNGFRPQRSCLDHIFTINNTCKIRKKLRQDTFLCFIDYQKAFDYVNHSLMYHKLLNIGITGNIYKSITKIYENPKSCVQLNGTLTDWFSVSSGVRQGDSLSPILFAIYINDLYDEIAECDAGISIGGEKLHMLLYADDIVMVSPNAEKAQKQLNVLTSWCAKCRMQINAKKSQILHIRNYQKPRSTTELHCCGQKLDYTDQYKYLGYILQENMSEKNMVEALTTSASRSFGRIVNSFKKLKNMGIKTYETLYESYVLSIANYAAGVWGFGEFQQPQVLQNRIQRFFLGVHAFAPVAATNMEFDWLSMKFLRWLEIIRYYNRLVDLPDHRWPKKILRWDRSLRTEGWFNQVQHIVSYANMELDPDSDCQIDLDILKARLLKLNRQRWRLESYEKSKLRTFVDICDHEKPRVIIEANLPRNHRSLVTKLKIGTLPLKLETGRWKDTPLEKRLCLACDQNLLESEYHFVIHCDAYRDTRTEFFQEVVNNTDLPVYGSEPVIMRTLLDESVIRITGRYLERMFLERKNLIFNQVSEDIDDE